jgi:hypothetical protein
MSNDYSEEIIVERCSAEGLSRTLLQRVRTGCIAIHAGSRYNDQGH